MTGGTDGTIEFTGAISASINGDTGFENLIISKGALSTTLTMNGTIQVKSSGSFILNGGLIKIDTGDSFAINRHQGFTIQATGGFEVNGGTLSTSDLTITNQGLIHIISGTANFGDSNGNSVNTDGNGAFVVENGSVNVSGRLTSAASGSLGGYTSGISISNGTITLATVANGLSGTGSLNVNSAGNFSFTGGTIVFQNPSDATTELDLGLISGSTKTTVGGTFQFGNALTPAGSVFNVSSNIPLNYVTSNGNARLELNSSLLVNQLNLNNKETPDSS